MSGIEERLGHAFRDPGLLVHSLTHRSLESEQPEQPSNERLEFLGDAVLQLVVTDFLFAEYPHLPEGEMAKVRAACVNRTELARIARRIQLGSDIRLGKGEEATGGREKSSILADALEAVLAAIYLDGGIVSARGVVLDHWQDLIREKATSPGRLDYKTRLQEVLAAQARVPAYEVEGDGPDHARVFSATVAVDGQVIGSGTGRSKKEAQQSAASEALAGLQRNGG
ncbi:MAG: ribonuclease III [Acidimicrobiia bacterium]